MIASAQERQPDLDDGSAFGAPPEVQDAAIGRNRRLDDREAQPRTSRLPGPGLITPGEGFSKGAGVARRPARAMIGAPENRIGSVCKHLDGRRRPRRIADQIPEDIQ